MYHKATAHAQRLAPAERDCRERGKERIPLCRIDSGIFIRQKDFHRKFLFADMLWIEASGNYSYIHLRNATRIIVVEQLSRIEPMLPADIFLRIHRSYIVNIQSIDAFIGNQLCIGEARLSISAPYRKHTMECFTILGKKRN